MQVHCGAGPMSRAERGRRVAMGHFRAMVVAAGTLAGVTARGNDFLDPKMCSESGGAAVRTSIATDIAFNAYLVWTSAGGGIHLDKVGVRDSWRLDLSADGLESGEASIALNSMGTVFIVFSRQEPGSLGREVYFITAGDFEAPPENVSRNPGDDHAPKMYIDSGGRPHLAWGQSAGNRTRVVYRPSDGPPRVAAEGDFPGLAVDGDGNVHLVYTRQQDLYALKIDRAGAAGGEVRVTNSPHDGEFFPSVAAAAGGVVLVAYERKGGLYLQESYDGGAEFGPPRLLDIGQVATPELRVTRDTLSIVYEKQGDLQYILGRVGGGLSRPQAITSTPEVESHPSLSVDQNGNLHSSFIRAGEVYYTNNAGELTAEFTSDRTSGEAPHEVRFSDLSRGEIGHWEWDFGDGSPPSSSRHPVHLYREPGKYSVSLTIYGTGTQARIEKRNYVFVENPSNGMWIPDNVVYPGQEGVWLPVMGHHKEPLDGFQIAGVFDPSVLDLVEASYQYTPLSAVKPDFFQPTIQSGPAGGMFFIFVVIDFPDYKARTIPPSGGHRLMNLVFNVPNEAPRGATTLVELKNGVGEEPVDNVFVIPGQAPLPVLKSSTVTVLDVEGRPQGLFKRGDIDGSLSVNLTDAIALLGYLFLGEAAPNCPDAADLDDSSKVDIADPISLLSFLFLGEAAPAIPFPNVGLDPTADRLPACNR